MVWFWKALKSCMSLPVWRRLKARPERGICGIKRPFSPLAALSHLFIPNNFDISVEDPSVKHPIRNPQHAILLHLGCDAQFIAQQSDGKERSKNWPQRPLGARRLI
jgi:hypothetical protein